MDKKLIGIIVVIIIAGALVAMFAKYQFGKDYTLDLTCESDSDCDWYDSSFGVNFPCGNCDLSSSEYLCINKKNAYELTEETRDKLSESLEVVPLCKPCLLNEEIYGCGCVEGKCVKGLR